MSKNIYIGFRASAEEQREIERICAGRGLTKTDYLRRAALAGPIPTSPTLSAPETDQGARLDSIEEQLEDMREALKNSADAFNALIQNLNEFLHVPSFREYRARDLANGTIKRDSESEDIFLLRLANRYYVQYRVWPDPADTQRFGPLPAGVDIQKFPKTPPVA